MWNAKGYALAAPVAAMLVAWVVASGGHFVARLASTAALAVLICGVAEGVTGEVTA